MLINFTKLVDDDRHNRTDWRYNCLMSVMTDHTPNAYHWKEAFGIDLSIPVTPSTPIMIDVKVLVNNVEVPFDKWISHIEESYNNMLDNHAQWILKEKFNSLNESLEKIEREAQIALGDALAVSTKQCVSTAWLLSQLAGMSFPEQGSAHEFIKNLIGIKDE